MTTILSLAILALTQDKPVAIAKADLPKEAICTVCADEHGAEKPAGGFAYKGKNYYFCSTKELAEFVKDPEAFVAPVLPRPMAKLELRDESGMLWNEDAMKGKVVLVDFWASWCKPCIAMFPKIDKLREVNKEKGFEVLSVSIDEKRGDLDKFLKKHTFPNPVLHDTSQTWNAWSVRAIPAMFLVKDGQVVAQWTGKIDESKLKVAIESYLSAE